MTFHNNPASIMFGIISVLRKMCLLTKLKAVLPYFFCYCPMFHSWSVENDEEKKCEIQKGSTLAVVREVYIQYLSHQMLVLACILSSVFAMCRNIFIFFCNVVFIYFQNECGVMPASVFRRFDDVCSGCGFFFFQFIQLLSYEQKLSHNLCI